MPDFQLDFHWETMEESDPLLAATTAKIKITLGDLCVTRNIDVWSSSPRDEILVSAYPLAHWMASSWWRLHHEVLPVGERTPRLDQRLSHELGAAGRGYVWPALTFTTDRRDMHVRAEPLPDHPVHSVRYLREGVAHAKVEMSVFTGICRNFIEKVVDRLNAEGLHGSELERAWSSIKIIFDDPLEKKKRELEAQFGFDAEDASVDFLEGLMAIQDEKGKDVLAELAAIGSWRDGDGARSIQHIFDARGIDAAPQIPELPEMPSGGEAWKRAKADATALREKVGSGVGRMKDSILADLLGVKTSDIESGIENERRPAAVAGRIDDRRIRLVTRKRHPLSRRFEMARLVGGYVDAIARDGNPWFVSTDAVTARQKYQRAFAAEFLCPIDALTELLDDDFSDDAIEGAASKFQVSDRTVSTQLMNNHIISRATSHYDTYYSAVD